LPDLPCRWRADPDRNGLRRPAPDAHQADRDDETPFHPAIEGRGASDYLLVRDQQKWIPVLRPIAHQLFELAHDLIDEPIPLRRIMR
jgi:hypothetical protein